MRNRGCLLQFQWAAHQSANQRFADIVLQNYSAGDVVWVQDYHLMLLPAMLKSRAPKMKVGCWALRAAHLASLLLSNPQKCSSQGMSYQTHRLIWQELQGVACVV